MSVRASAPITPTFADWTGGRSLPSLGTNAGAAPLAFQKWRHFKEAFAPELIARATEESDIKVRRCLDPFGGSGTTALACQFLGVEPTTIEVNPYLADLIEAKLAPYDADAVVSDLAAVLRLAIQKRDGATLNLAPTAPPTMVEPGLDGRWIFDAGVASRLGALLAAIDGLENARHRRLFRVLVGGILIDVSNVVVNGKGRRYRGQWETRRRDATRVEQLFADAVRGAVSDIHRFARRACNSYRLLRGDARSMVLPDEPVELAVFSPPYPNSFDYTDVYNVELWTLGYLTDRQNNRALRQSTLCSHVQIDRTYPPAPEGSPLLNEALRGLKAAGKGLWHRRIPDMVAGYFADLGVVISRVRERLHPEGAIWLVVGDSRYADVLVPAADILAELSPSWGLERATSEPFRSMRAAAQQGGNYELSETLLVLKPAR